MGIRGWFGGDKPDNAQTQASVPVSRGTAQEPLPDERARAKTAGGDRDRAYFRTVSFRREEDTLMLGPENEEYMEAVRSETDPAGWTVQRVFRGQNIALAAPANPFDPLAARTAPGGFIHSIEPVRQNARYMEALQTLSRYERGQPLLHAASGMKAVEQDHGDTHFREFAHRDLIVFDVDGEPHLTENGHPVAKGTFPQEEIATLKKWQEIADRMNRAGKIDGTSLTAAFAAQKPVPAGAVSPIALGQMKSIMDDLTKFKECLNYGNYRSDFRTEPGLQAFQSRSEQKFIYRGNSFYCSDGSEKLSNPSFDSSFSDAVQKFIQKVTDAIGSAQDLPVLPFLKDIRLTLTFAVCRIFSHNSWTENYNQSKVELLENLHVYARDKYGNDAATIDSIMMNAVMADSTLDTRNRFLDVYIEIKNASELMNNYFERLKQAMKSGDPLPPLPFNVMTSFNAAAGAGAGAPPPTPHPLNPANSHSSTAGMRM